ncbi:hypothetical protein PG994_006312 [Apiospora phragmitis]|uniref:Uncharacterized protein n=1 Tax=Apiospora phragmitis TaxID=2905665 RepID=A0ABR1VHB2_9PEZI
MTSSPGCTLSQRWAILRRQGDGFRPAVATLFLLHHHSSPPKKQVVYARRTVDGGVTHADGAAFPGWTPLEVRSNTQAAEPGLLWESTGG